MKKMLAIVITVIMLMSVCSIQSFAFTVKLPTVTGIDLIEIPTVSKKDLDNAYNDYIEGVNELKESYPEFYDEDMEEDFKFYVWDFMVELTLSDGSEVLFDIDYSYDIDNYTTIFVDAYITYDEYMSLDDESDSAEIVFDCSVYSYISDIEKKSVFTYDADLVDCFVRSIVPVSAIDYTAYEDADYLDVVGEKFLVTYADGTTGIYTVKLEFVEDDRYYDYFLNGEVLGVYLDEETVTFTYMDEEYEHTVDYVETPYEGITVTGYEFDEINGLTSVSYYITKKDGTSESFTADLTPFITEGLYPSSWENINIYDGYDVYLFLGEVYEETYPYQSSGEYELGMQIGYYFSNHLSVPYIETENSDDDVKFNLATFIEDVIAMILMRFFSIINFFK